MGVAATLPELSEWTLHKSAQDDEQDVLPGSLVETLY